MPSQTLSIAFSHIGEVDYEEALTLQREIHRAVVAGSTPHTVLFLEHPSIYTAGKRTLDIERPTNGERVIDVDRGGKITWHGPGQLVGYPIVRLKNPHELVGFVRSLEEALIKTCAHFGIESVRLSGRSGVWIKDGRGERKIAAIGIRVAQGVTMHGFALNISPDLSKFEAIIPCGISDADVTSISRELSRDIRVDDVLPILETELTCVLSEVVA